MTKVRIIGDVHAKFQEYFEIAEVVENSIQVGDFGFGFFRPHEMVEIVQWVNKNPSHLFIRGNHDHPQIAEGMGNYISDGYYDRKRSIFYFGGAKTPDNPGKVLIPGINWWPDEEVTEDKFLSILTRYEIAKPRVVISHDFPQSYVEDQFGHEITNTREILQELFEIHQPDYWIGGHHHISRREKRQNTQFITLKELEYFDLDLPDAKD